MQRTIGDLLRLATDVLTDAGIDEPRREALMLAGHIFGLDRLSIKRESGRLVDASHFLRLLERRSAREPMAFILGRQGFWTLDLHVAPQTLIPRADTETLIEAALLLFPDRTSIQHILDLGSGTGCLLLAALSEFPEAHGIGVDLRPESAALGRRNAAANGLADRAAFMAGNWATALSGTFDLILSNPPYIPAADIANLMPEVRRYEPASALDGGADGLDAYRTIIAAAPSLLTENGALILELGIGQADSVSALAHQSGFRRVTKRADLGGIDRALIIRR